MKKSKIIIIVLASVSTLFFVAASSYFFVLFAGHLSTLDAAEDNSEYYSDFLLKKDGYILKTKVLKDDEYGDKLYFTVSDSKNNIVFDSYNDSDDIWRIQDFKGIEFSSDSLDIIVESGDVGTSVFRHNEKGWSKTQ